MKKLVEGLKETKKQIIVTNCNECPYSRIEGVYLYCKINPTYKHSDCVGKWDRRIKIPKKMCPLPDQGLEGGRRTWLTGSGIVKAMIKAINVV